MADSKSDKPVHVCRYPVNTFGPSKELICNCSFFATCRNCGYSLYSESMHCNTAPNVYKCVYAAGFEDVPRRGEWTTVSA